MNTPPPQSFEIIFDKRDELLFLDPGQRIQSAEIIATCDMVREVNDILTASEEQPCFTYTRG